MKLIFEVEEYEDTKDEPFELFFYFCKRLYMYIVENGKKRELLNSTFHDGLLLDIGDWGCPESQNPLKTKHHKH
ncbi:hypothetical protein NSR00_14370 [Aeribacillus sp. FSL K6-8394]|uniref:hypothetical protein n=1 Tax=Aeribacillus sp. FSL K6-8394 TaxID=2954570 RepID=UPI0030F8416D